MHRFRGPGWRVAGSALSWLLFAFSFTALYQAAAVVSGLGGFCASGGPYVIETECPESVIVFAPLAFPGIFLAAGLALVFARGFGTPLVVWGWPILFVGLGWNFLDTALKGAADGWFLAVLFFVMGATPLVWELRGGLRRVLLGSHDVRDRRFVERENVPRTIYTMTRPDRGEEVVEPTFGAWVLSLGTFLVSAGLGVYLALTAFAAIAASG